MRRRLGRWAGAWSVATAAALLVSTTAWTGTVRWYPYTNLNFIITGITKIKKGAWLIVEDIPFKTKPIWEIVSFIINTKQKSFLIKTKNCYIFLINKIR